MFSMLLLFLFRFLASKSKIGIKPDVKRRKMDGPIIDLELNKGENREKELFRIRKGIETNSLMFYTFLLLFKPYTFIYFFSFCKAV